MTSKAKPKFPKTITVTLEGQDTRDEFLSIHDDDLSDIAETTHCAVYELVRVTKIEVTRKIK